jgi:hypothetical protein
MIQNQKRSCATEILESQPAALQEDREVLKITHNLSAASVSRLFPDFGCHLWNQCLFLKVC